MAIGDDYITSAELKAYMGLEINTYDALLADAISSTSREIEDFCHRQFHTAGAATARVYQPLDPARVFVDDFHTAVGLIVETDDDNDGIFETVWAASDYELRPLNGVRNGQPGWPYWEIAAVGSKRFTGSCRANVRVTADWGWAAIPEPVRQAAFILASDTFQLKDQRLGIAGSDQFGQIVRVRDNQLAASKLKHYVRQKAYVA